jgi:hypothetical protein
MYTNKIKYLVHGYDGVSVVAVNINIYIISVLSMFLFTKNEIAVVQFKLATVVF